MPRGRRKRVSYRGFDVTAREENDEKELRQDAAMLAELKVEHLYYRHDTIQEILMEVSYFLMGGTVDGTQAGTELELEAAAKPLLELAVFEPAVLRRHVPKLAHVLKPRNY